MILEETRSIHLLKQRAVHFNNSHKVSENLAHLLIK